MRLDFDQGRDRTTDTRIFKAILYSADFGNRTTLACLR